MGGVGCDNMTVILVCFLHGRSYAELVERCSRPISSTHRHSCCNIHGRQGEHFHSSCPNFPGADLSVQGEGKGELDAYNNEDSLGRRGLACGGGLVSELEQSDGEGHSADHQQLSCIV